MSSVRIEDVTEVNDEVNAAKKPAIKMEDIKKELDIALNNYEKTRFAGEPPRTHYRRDIFHKGYSANDRQQSINQLRDYVEGEAHLFNAEQIKAYRKGNLGDAIRTAAQKLSKDFGMPEIKSVSGLIEYIGKTRGLTNKNEVEVEAEEDNISSLKA